MSTTTFRSRALRRISSPEQLDRLVRVTSPRHWIGLGGLLLLVVGVLLWSTVSVVPTTVSASSTLLPLGGLREVQAPVSGTVSSFPVAVGTHVVAGQAIGTVTVSGRGPATIRAADTGTITEVDTAQRAVVQSGQRLALIEPVGWPLVVYAYAPTQVAARLAVGTPVHVKFGAGVDATYGYARGVVASVSEYAATPERLNFVLRDTASVESVQSLGPTNEVVIPLELAAQTPSGIAWGTGGGPPAPLPAGLPATAVFVVGSHHPIDDVL